MSTIDTLECIIIGALYAILHHKKRTTTKLFQIVEQLLGHTVGTCTYNQPYHAIYRQSLLIHSLQSRKLSIRISVSLEIGQITHCRVFTRKESHTIHQLLRHTQLRSAIFRIKSLIITVGASTHSHSTISIGAGKSCMYRNLLHLTLEILSKEGPKIIVQLMLHIHDANLRKHFGFLNYEL